MPTPRNDTDDDRPRSRYAGGKDRVSIVRRLDQQPSGGHAGYRDECASSGKRGLPRPDKARIMRVILGVIGSVRLNGAANRRLASATVFHAHRPLPKFVIPSTRALRGDSRFRLSSSSATLRCEEVPIQKASDGTFRRGEVQPHNRKVDQHNQREADRVNAHNRAVVAEFNRRFERLPQDLDTPRRNSRLLIASSTRSRNAMTASGTRPLARSARSSAPWRVASAPERPMTNRQPRSTLVTAVLKQLGHAIAQLRRARAAAALIAVLSLAVPTAARADVFNGRIAFSSERDGNLEIYSMNADGTGLTRLTRNQTPDYRPSWR